MIQRFFCWMDWHHDWDKFMGFHKERIDPRAKCTHCGVTYGR